MVGTERRPTRWDTWDRFAPLTGIVAVLLWIVGVVVMESIGGPGEGGPEAYPRYYDDEGGGILGASTTFAIGTLFFLWFLGTLRASVHGAEGGVGRLAGIAYAGGLAFGVLSLATMAPDAAGAIRYWVDDETLEPAAAEALNALGSGFFLLVELSAALFLIATALAVLRTRVLPAWLAWVTVLLGVVLLIPPIGWAGLLFFFPLWIVLVSVLLVQRVAG